MIADVPTLLVFSHPNHEMAVYGILQRVDARLVFLTDGGSPARTEQTKKGLARVGLSDRVTFMGHSEASFYEAILNKDLCFFEGVVDSLQAICRSWRPIQVLSDAVEFYNPVHDIALPIALAAYGLGEGFYEIPLVHQVKDDLERYVIQRAPAECQDQVLVDLQPDEFTLKMDVFHSVYRLLEDVIINTLRAEPIARQEALIPVRIPSRLPEASVILRYDWRAKKLLAEGRVERAITWKDHYLPCVDGILRIG